MKYAVIGDIHANLEALTAALEKCQELGVDAYLCIGDIVGYNASPRECLEIIRHLNCEVITKGNHDEQASSEMELVGFNPQAARAIEWTRNQLTEEQRIWMAGLPYRQTIGARMTLVHATLDMPHMWGYVFDKYSAEVCLGYQFTQICLFGHTHVPLAFEKYGTVNGGRYDEIRLLSNHKYLINVGSIGQPRDGDPRAAFVTYSPDDRLVQLHRVEYDVGGAQRKIIAAGLPDRLAQRLGVGR
jgi:predicted phosphodiesterase